MNRRGEDRRQMRMDVVRDRRRQERRQCDRRVEYVAWKRPRSEDLRDGERTYMERRHG